MKLYFDRSKVAKIIEATESGRGHIKPYTGRGWGTPQDNTPGIILVGDQGIYLMGNEEKVISPIKLGLVAYAKGCDPNKDMDWWSLKQATFGPDDGAEFIALSEAKKLLLTGKRPYVEITPDQVAWGSC